MSDIENKEDYKEFENDLKLLERLASVEAENKRLRDQKEFDLELLRKATEQFEVYRELIRQTEAERDRMKEIIKNLKEIIQGCRPHFEKTRLSCLDDCDEGIEMAEQALSEKGGVE